VEVSLEQACRDKERVARDRMSAVVVMARGVPRQGDVDVVVVVDGRGDSRGEGDVGQGRRGVIVDDVVLEGDGLGELTAVSRIVLEGDSAVVKGVVEYGAPT